MPKLSEGVDLHILPTQKYKTLRVQVRFTAPLEKDLASKRTLLSSLLETSCEKYPSQQQVAEVLANLYGASFGLQVNRKGGNHFLSATLNMVNDRFLTEKAVAKKGIAFLKEMLWHPYFVEGIFHEATFNREKANLLSYWDSLLEDKGTYANLALQKEYFTDPNQKEPSFGSQETLKALTNEEMTKYYFKMLAEDKIDIFVIGDVKESEVVAWFKDFDFSKRTGKMNAFSYEQEIKPMVAKKTEVEEVLQSKLHLAYTTPLALSGKNYFVALVFNGIFGGFPHSKLFMNVREKESLAYYASSSLDIYRSCLTVQTGIQAVNETKVEGLIAAELTKMQAGEITDLEIQQTKANLKNQFLIQQDSPQGELAFLQRQLLLSKTITEKEWLEALQGVSKADIQAFAKAVHLQNIFFLKGVTHE